VRVFRARAWRGSGPLSFDPLDSSGSVSGPKGWRFNDLGTEILYAAEVESLATLEVVIRPGLATIEQILVAAIDLPDDSVTTLSALGLTLPSNWNARPVADDSRSIAREFLNALAAIARARRPIGVRVPSVLSGTDSNVLIDPSRRGELTARLTHRIPLRSYLATAT
jgi:RES domain-containing protein